MSPRRRTSLVDLAAIRRAGAALAPLPAQLDLDGRLHEIAPQTERMRLFEPAPTQLDGQLWLADEAASTTNEGA